MSIPKKGGYSGGRPASEMGPPANLPSATNGHDDLTDLCILALLHAQYDEVTPEHRARVLELVVRLSNVAPPVEVKLPEASGITALESVTLRGWHAHAVCFCGKPFTEHPPGPPCPPPPPPGFQHG